MHTIDKREEQIFLEALDIESPEERAALLDRSCGDDATLRRRVERLLNFHQRSDFILDSTAVFSTPAAPSEADSLCGERVGNYTLVRQLGEGGMGVVYLAEQHEPVQRRVAVKVIKLGMDTRQVIARFEAERQALAMMDHPCITRVFDAGATASGRPYFVMETVEGSCITKYCDENKLPLEKRLELFIQVCGAIQHAHQKGVIHRDIKPSNILVSVRDGIPVPKVIDFGIAKATRQRVDDFTTLTHCAGMIGTPEYMSPEQAEVTGIDIDTRSDIYSLGAMLYELVTGSTPFRRDDLKKKNYLQIRDIIQTREPELPSVRLGRVQNEDDSIFENRSTDLKTLHRNVSRDLDWVVMKCLFKDRTRRYNNAADLAREIERYLAGDPVDAVRPTLAYKFGKFANRYRAVLVATVVVSLLLAASTVVSVLFSIKANAAAREARNAANLAEKRANEANSASVDAEFARIEADQVKQSRIRIERQSRDRLAIARAISRFNLAAFAPSGSGEPLTRRHYLITDSMRRYLGDLADVVIGRQAHNATQSNPPNNIERLQADAKLLELIREEQIKTFGQQDLFVAKTHYQLGQKYLALNQSAQATQALRKSLVIRENQAPDEIERIESMIALGRSLARQSNSLESRHYLSQAIQLLERFPSKHSLRASAELELQRLDAQR